MLSQSNTFHNLVQAVLEAAVSQCTTWHRVPLQHDSASTHCSLGGAFESEDASRRCQSPCSVSCTFWSTCILHVLGCSVTRETAASRVVNPGREIWDGGTAVISSLTGSAIRRPTIVGSTADLNTCRLRFVLGHVGMLMSSPCLADVVEEFEAV